MAFHFDTNGNVIVDSWQTSESKEFSRQELAESYVMASREDIMEKDPKAKETLNSYLNKTVNDNMRIFSVIEKEKIDSDNHEEHVSSGENEPKKCEHCSERTSDHKPKEDSNRTYKRFLRFQRWERGTERYKRSHWVHVKGRNKTSPVGIYQLVRVFGSRKYKPVALKVRPVKADLPKSLESNEKLKAIL